MMLKLCLTRCGVFRNLHFCMSFPKVDVFSDWNRCLCVNDKCRLKSISCYWMCKRGNNTVCLSTGVTNQCPWSWWSTETMCVLGWQDQLVSPCSQWPWWPWKRRRFLGERPLAHVRKFTASLLAFYRKAASSDRLLGTRRIFGAVRGVFIQCWLSAQGGAQIVHLSNLSRSSRKLFNSRWKIEKIDWIA